MSNLIVNMVKSKLRILTTSRDQIITILENLENELKENNHRLNNINSQIIECEKFLEENQDDNS